MRTPIFDHMVVGRLFCCLMVLVFGCTATSGFANPPTPAWLHPEVIRAAVAIELTEAQKPAFRASVTQLVNDRIKAANRLLRRNNVSDLQRQLKTASRRQFKKMDQRMASLLTEQQYPKYQVYSDLLRARMADRIGSNTAAENDEAAATLQGISSGGHH